MTPCQAYLAGPDVFLPHAAAHAAAKIAICEKYNITGRPPLHPDIARIMALPPDAAWREIYQWDVAMMQQCDIVIANLTPFRGASADAGTLVEIGWFLGRGRPVFGYSNSAESFLARSQAQLAALPDPIPGLELEGFGLSDNLMIPGAAEYGGGLPITLPAKTLPFDSLEVFEACVKEAAAFLKKSGAKNF
jgi:nucleoside 2-deoxyribosyltransferase